MAIWREQRVRKELPVRVRGVDYEGNPFIQETYTIDISRRGARLEWLSCLKGVGEVVEVQFGREKAQFRVVWIGRVGTPQDNQVGICSLEPAKYLWHEPLPPPRLISPTEARAEAHLDSSPTNQRRRWPRYRCLGGVQVWQEGAQTPQGGTLSEISLGGCYIETSWPLPAGKQVEVLLRARELEVRAKGVVGYWHPSMGMGILFREMGDEDRQRLEQLTSRLAVFPAG